MIARERHNVFPGGPGLKHTRDYGFTLIELVIVLAVLAILSAIAVNSYRDYVLRSNRTEAMAALKDLAQREEEYFGNRQTYTSSLSTLNVSATTANDLYTLQIPASTTTSYTLRATAINSQLQDNTCRTFELTDVGQQSAEDASTNDTTAECWER